MRFESQGQLRFSLRRIFGRINWEEWSIPREQEVTKKP